MPALYKVEIADPDSDDKDPVVVTRPLVSSALQALELTAATIRTDEALLRNTLSRTDLVIVVQRARTVGGYDDPKAKYLANFPPA